MPGLFIFAAIQWTLCLRGFSCLAKAGEGDHSPSQIMPVRQIEIPNLRRNHFHLAMPLQRVSKHVRRWHLSRRCLRRANRDGPHHAPGRPFTAHRPTGNLPGPVYGSIRRQAFQIAKLAYALLFQTTFLSSHLRQRLDGVQQPSPCDVCTNASSLPQRDARVAHQDQPLVRLLRSSTTAGPPSGDP